MSNNEDLQTPDEQVEEVTEQAEKDQTFEEKVESLTAELNKALEEVATHKDVAIRAKAESENIRRRAEREVSNASKFALERFAKEILAVVDSLEKALEHPVENDAQAAMHQGIELTHKLLIDTLNKFSIEQISPLGDAFDPGLHEAMVMQESDEHEPNSVMQVIQMGYSLNGRLIRPARVIVAKGKAPEIDQKA
ncbi:nucleotide exchange factor GrpE [Aliikangiella coralliicola]|uniref:Protein GrpE n=1 Tax=Aliikangiella coralliicola TaxID=2592383 RepID=A0A545UGQ1_9GAMM|nr:nucleotide exchange factor GrpE [Aliikangiella coralliicola]TQV88640.1 nucleotide exchange factor GrpE [Aliikangiella coralliicola]